MRQAGPAGAGGEVVEEDHDPGSRRRGEADRIRPDFTADASRLNTRWCGDITYIPTWEGRLYLATVCGERGEVTRLELTCLHQICWPFAGYSAGGKRNGQASVQERGEVRAGGCVILDRGSSRAERP
jgi:transposase InsO family protein